MVSSRDCCPDFLHGTTLYYIQFTDIQFELGQHHWIQVANKFGRHLAIGIDSFNKNTPYYTKNNTPADVFGALTFMMSSTLEHFTVPDKDSTLNDTLMVQIKASSEPSKKTPNSLHSNSFGKVNKTFCRFVIEYIAMSLYFDYWGDHATMSAPAPLNKVSTSSEFFHI